MSSAKVRYEVEITGDRAPYEWQLYRVDPSGQRLPLATGDSESFDGAQLDAAEKARELEDRRRHMKTKEVVVLFEADDVGARFDDDDIPVVEKHPDISDPIQSD